MLPPPSSHEPSGDEPRLPATAASASGRRIQRVAHRAGNGRAALRAAVAAQADWVEADVWYQYGRIVARHERGLWRLPIVYDRWLIRPHLRALYLEEILGVTAGGPRVLLDFKGRHPPLPNAVAKLLRRDRAIDRAAVCGQFWRPLDELGRLEPGLASFYSLGKPQHVNKLVARLDAGLTPAGVSIASWLLTAELTRTLRERGLEVFVWTVNDRAAAERFVAWGATGIISDRLDVLAELP